MLLFIKKIILFLLVVTIGVIAVVKLVNYKMDNHKNYELVKGTKNLILGHSHSECVYDNSLINNTINLSQSGEAYFYTYIKLRRLLTGENNVKNVFIEFSNNQLSKKDNWIFEDKNILYRYPMYSTFMTSDEISLLFKKNPRAVLSSQPYASRKSLIYLLGGKKDMLNSWGGYQKLKYSKVDSLIKVGKTGIEDERLPYSKESTNFKSLEKMIDLCEEENKTVYLIRSPLHKKYTYSISDSTLYKVVKEKFSNIKFIDLKNFPLNNEDFADFEHLNYKGAKKVSKFFNVLLSNHLLEDKNYQVRIDSLMNSYEL